MQADTICLMFSLEGGAIRELFKGTCMKGAVCRRMSILPIATPLEKMSFSASATIKCLEMFRVRGSLVSSSLLQHRMFTGPNVCRLLQPLGLRGRQWPCHAWKTAFYDLTHHQKFDKSQCCCGMFLFRNKLREES